MMIPGRLAYTAHKVATNAQTIGGRWASQFEVMNNSFKLLDLPLFLLQ